MNGSTANGCSPSFQVEAPGMFVQNRIRVQGPILLGPVVFPQADQDVLGGEVLVPGWVEEAVGGGEDPLITDQTGAAQQLLRTALVQHHLPGVEVLGYDSNQHESRHSDGCAETIKLN